MKFTGLLTRNASAGVTASEALAANAQPVHEQVIALYERHRGSLFRYLRSFGLNDSDCEEVIQEAFLALFRHLLGGKPGHNLQAWLFQVARNQMMKRYQRRSEEVDLAWAKNVFDRGEDPEQVLIREQDRSRLASVVRALPEQDRECLVLRSEGFRYREIAAIQGRSLGAVCAALKRSLAKISEVYGS